MMYNVMVSEPYRSTSQQTATRNDARVAEWLGRWSANFDHYTLHRANVNIHVKELQQHDNNDILAMCCISPFLFLQF